MTRCAEVRNNIGCDICRTQQSEMYPAPVRVRALAVYRRSYRHAESTRLRLGVVARRLLTIPATFDGRLYIQTHENFWKGSILVHGLCRRQCKWTEASVITWNL